LDTLQQDPADGVRRALRLKAGTRTTIRTSRTWTRFALSALAASVALLAGGISSAAAAPAATAKATGDCWLAVVNDWLDNSRVDRVYAVPCYTQAIQHLNSYPDVQNYSNATDDIQRALLAAIRQDRGGGPGAGPGPGGNNSPSGNPGTGATGKPPGGSKPRGFLSSWSPSSAQSIPLPLLVLGGLALLLLAAAGATLVARRVQARRGGRPVPPRTPAVDKRS
jgi:hypothetical protein